MTTEEENNLRAIKVGYRTEQMRGSNIQGYSTYAVDNMLKEAYILGKDQREKELNEQFKQLKNVQNS